MVLDWKGEGRSTLRKRRKLLMNGIKSMISNGFKERDAEE